MIVEPSRWAPRWAPSEPLLTRLSPDRRRVAFTCRDGEQTTLYACDAAERHPPYGDGGDEVPADGGDPSEASLVRLCDCGARPVRDLAWSPDGTLLAYRLGGFPPGFGEDIGWVGSTTPGELGRVAGLAFAWAPRSPALYVADPDEATVRRVAIDGRRHQRLADFLHFREAEFWPRLAPSPDGKRLAFTTRDDPADLWRVFCIEAEQGEPATTLVTTVPGADAHVLPLWSPGSVSLGLFIVHVALQTSGFIVLRAMRGEGELFYQQEGTDGPVTPAWAPDGRALVLYRWVASVSAERPSNPTPTNAEDDDLLAESARPDPLDPRNFPTGSPDRRLPEHQLTLLDLATGSTVPLADPGGLCGEPRFLDDELVQVDGGSQALLLRLRRRSAER